MVKKRDSNVGGTARYHNLSTKKQLELRGVHPTLVAAATLPLIGDFIKNCVGLDEDGKENALAGSLDHGIDTLNVSRRPDIKLSSRESDSCNNKNNDKAPVHVRINTYLEKEKERGKYEAYYALKSIHLDRVRDPLFVNELKNEIEIMKRLDHPHISRLIETYEDKGQLFLVLELCNGGDLYSRDPYTEDQAARIVGSILSAVDFMHSHGIVHRDLKYENILFANSSPTAEIK